MILLRKFKAGITFDSYDTKAHVVPIFCSSEAGADKFKCSLGQSRFVLSDGRS